jgi:hypothetical protein
MNRTSTIVTALALAAAGTAFAQGTPPTTASPTRHRGRPAKPRRGTDGHNGHCVAEQQRSGGSGTSSGSAPMSGSMSTGSSNDTNAVGSNSRPMRPARADRN